MNPQIPLLTRHSRSGQGIYLSYFGTPDADRYCPRITVFTRQTFRRDAFLGNPNTASITTHEIQSLSVYILYLLHKVK